MKPSSSKRKAEERLASAGRKHLQEALRLLNIQYEEEHNAEHQYTDFNLQYQSGTFVVRAFENEIYYSFFYPACHSAPFSELENARIVCNDLTSESILGSVVYTLRPEKSEIAFHCVGGGFLMPTVELQAKALSEQFRACFGHQHELRKRLLHIKKVVDDSTSNDLELTEAVHQQLLLWQDLARPRHKESPADDSARLQQIFSSLRTVTLDELLQAFPLPVGFALDAICIVGAQSDLYERIEDAEAAGKFALHTHLVQQHADQSVTFKEAAITITASYTLQQERKLVEQECDEENLTYDVPLHYFSILLTSLRVVSRRAYYQATITFPAAAPSPHVCMHNPQALAQSTTFLLVYDCTPEEELRAELEYFAATARDKGEKPKNAREKAFKEIVPLLQGTEIEECVLRGKLLLHDRQYLKAAQLLENAWYANGHNFLNGNVTDAQRELQYRLSFLLAVCHCEMRNFQKAAFFAEGTLECQNILYTQQDLLSMIHARDYRSRGFVENLIQIIQNNLNEAQEGNSELSTPSLAAFMQRLECLRAYLAVEGGNQEEAAALLQPLLESEDESIRDFAISELAFLQHQKSLEQ